MPLIGFDELFTSYNKSAEKYARGVYCLTSYYHCHENFKFRTPFVAKIGLSMNLYYRLSSYNLYYPEGCWVLAFVFLPLSASEKDVSALESSIHSLGDKYANEWFHVKSCDHLANMLKAGSRAFPQAIVVSDLSRKVTLPSTHIPIPLRDKKVIERIAKEQALATKKQAELEARSKAELAHPKSPTGWALLTTQGTRDWLAQ